MHPDGFGLIGFAMAATLVAKNAAALLVKTFDMIGRGPLRFSITETFV